MNSIEKFKWGQGWKERYARLTLPILVQLAEANASRPDQMAEFTYQDLANAVNQPKHAHPMEHALGCLGSALRDLRKSHSKWAYGAVPPIQLLVWSKGKHSPGDVAFGFLDFSKEQIKDFSRRQKQELATHARSRILTYPHWREVLRALDVKPLIADLPNPDQITLAPDRDGVNGLESRFHLRLKNYLAQPPEALGLAGSFTAALEAPLMSGDRADLILRDERTRSCVCVEVKSRVSGDADLIRGLFQCVKYKVVLEAHEKYELAAWPNKKRGEIQVILAVERPLERSAELVSKLFGIQVATIHVPDDFRPQRA